MRAAMRALRRVMAPSSHGRWVAARLAGNYQSVTIATSSGRGVLSNPLAPMKKNALRWLQAASGAAEEGGNREH